MLFHLLYYLVLTCGFFNCQEEIRRHTLECLEEETIKTSNLRFRMQSFPGEIIAEMTGSTDLTSSEKNKRIEFSMHLNNLKYSIK